MLTFKAFPSIAPTASSCLLVGYRVDEDIQEMLLILL